MKKWIFIFFSLWISINAQVDTTDWYPLHIGDKWEYYGQGFGYSQVEVIGDTLMPNGYNYFIFSGGVFAWRFQRKQNDELIYYYDTAKDKENLLFNFNVDDRTLWEEDIDYYWGILETNYDHQNLINTQLPYKIFERAIIDTTIKPPDTTWGYLIDAYPTRITKGFGITSYMYDIETLVGANVNGVGYGTLVGVDENKKTPNRFKIYQNYPNPFNPSTTISYQLPKKGQVALKIYNSLGKEIKELVNSYKGEGSYSIKFDGSELPSGVYFYKITAGTFTATKKLILMK